jgi:hypothetical protein
MFRPYVASLIITHTHTYVAGLLSYIMSIPIIPGEPNLAPGMLVAYSMPYNTEKERCEQYRKKGNKR